MTTQPAGEHHTGALNLTDQDNPETPDPVLYWCPTAREIEQHPGGGFDTCCHVPELHEPILTEVYAAIRQHVAEQTPDGYSTVERFWEATWPTLAACPDECGDCKPCITHWAVNWTLAALSNPDLVAKAETDGPWKWTRDIGREQPAPDPTWVAEEKPCEACQAKLGGTS